MEHCLHCTYSACHPNNRNYYTDLLKTTLLPECRRLSPGSDFVFVQDSAPSHRAKATQQFLRQNSPNVIAADEWALYFLDLNPLDYCIWDILQDLVYRGWRLPLSNLQDLKEAINGRRLPLRQFD